MAKNEIFIDAPPTKVFDVLSDPRSYGFWVVGAHTIRGADADWPAVGSAFDHRVGVGPFTLDDQTSVLACSPPSEIVLIARASPLPPARVRLRLRREASGTHLTMVEAPVNRVLSALLGPLGHRLLWIRNVESLRRLKRLAEGDAAVPKHELPVRDGG